MLPAVQLQLISSLRQFCDHFWSDFGRRRINDPESLAMEFRRFCGIERKLNFERLQWILTEQMSACEIRLDDRLGSMNGMHFRMQDQFVILIRSTDSPEAKLFTLCHEVREILGVTFKDLHSRFVDISGDDLEAHSDVFAATLIYGEEAFSVKAFETGLDPIRMGDIYNRSYRTTIHRMAHTLANLPHPVPFWGTILERRPGTPPNCLISGGSFRSPKFTRASRDKLPNVLFAKRGRLVRIKGNLRQALRHMRSVYIESLEGLDLWNGQRLTVVIRPHLGSAGIDRLIIVAVPKAFARRFRDQVMKSGPLTVEDSFQEI
jgi:hypothetical protein